MIRKSNESVVDSRVVELTLDNSTFEKNATESISTISKLKKALDFQDAGKGLDEIDRGIKSININVLTEGVRSLRDEFNALDVIGVRTISRLTDKVENAAEAFLKSFTIDPVSDGWTKYAEKTTAVQTIMASTASAFNDVGEQTEYVYKQLDKLNWFTDETSYSFTDMVGNIGKFTSNSVDLDVAVTAMQGIANWAAISGQNASEASRAMYNLSQAISLGYVQLIDWKSIQNANMATTEFKQTALDTAVSLNMLKKTADNTYQTLAGHTVSVENFTSALTDKWFTTDVLLKTLDAYGGFTDKLYALQQKTGIYTTELLGYLEEYNTNVDVINKVAEETDVSAEELRKDFDELSSSTYDLGKRSFRAGQEAKTFAEALEATKEAAGTAWSELFETMFGDYEHAKKLWTDLSETLFTIFVEPVQTLNDQLELAMGATDNAIDRSKWSELERSGLANPEFMKAVMLNAKSHGVAVENYISDQDSLDRALAKTLDIGIESANGLNAGIQKFTGGTSNAIEKTITDMEAFRGSMLSVLDEDAFYRALDDGVITIELINDTIDQLTGSTEANADSVNQSLESIRNEAIRVLRSQESGYDTNLKKRFEQLTENGFDAQAVQDYVNIWHELTNGTWDMSEATMAAVDAKWLETHAIEAQGEAVNNIAGMSEEDMEKAREAAKQMAGQMALGLSGAALWRIGLGNLMKTAVNVADAIKDAFMDVFFPPDDNGSDDLFSKVKNGLKTLGGVPLELYNIITAFHDFTEWLKTSTENSEELRSVFRGVFSVVDLLVRGFLTIRKMKVAAIFGFFEGLGLPLQDLVVKIGNLVFAFHNWVVEGGILNRLMEYTAGIAWGLGTAIRLVFETITNIPFVDRTLRRFKIGFSAFADSLIPLIDGTKDKFVEFYGKVKDMGGIHPSNLGEILAMFKTDVVDYIANFDGFKKLSKAFELTGRDIKLKMDKFLQDTLLPWLSGLGPAIVKALPKILSTIATGISNGWDVITGVISGLISGLTTAIFNIFGVDLSFLQTIFEGIAVGVKAVATVVGGALITAFAALINIVSTVIGVLQSAWGAIKDFFKRFTKSGSGGGGGGGGSPTAAISSFDKFKNKFVSIIDKIKKVIAIGNRVFELFFNKLASFDNISFDAIVESFNFAKEALFDYLSHKFPGFARFRYEFDAVVKKIKEGLANMGLDSEGIKSKWNKFSTFAGNAFERIYKGAKDLGSNVVKTVSDFLANPIVKKNIDNFKGAFGDAWGNLGDFFSGLWDTVINWWNGIAEGGTLDFKNIGDWIVSLKDAIKSYFGDFHGFDSIKNAFSQAWDDIVKTLEENGVLAKLETFKEEINKALKDFSLTDAFNAFVGLFTKSNEDLDEATGETETKAGGMLGVLSWFITEVDKLVSGFELDKAFNDFLDLFKTPEEQLQEAGENTEESGNFFTNVIINLIDGLKKALEDFPYDTLETVLDSIGGFLTGLGIYNMGKGVKAFGKAIKGQNNSDLFTSLSWLFGSITALIGVIGLETWALDGEKFRANLEAVAVCIGAISGIITAASVLIEQFGTGLPSGSTYTLSNGWAVLDNLLGKIIDKGFIIMLIQTAGEVMKELMTVEDFDSEKALAAAQSLSIVAGVGTILAEVIGAFGKAGVDGAAATKGMSAIGAVLLEGGGVMALIGGVCEIMDYLTGENMAKTLGEWVDTGGDLLVKVATKIGEVVGALFGGIFTGFFLGVTSDAPDVASNIVAFVEAIKPLTDSEHAFDGETLKERIGSLTESVKEISSAGLSGAMNDFASRFLTMDITGKSKGALDVFKESVDAIKEVITSWNETFPEGGDLKFDKEGFDALVQSVEDIPSLSFGEFISKLIGGDTDVGAFADDMGKLGAGISSFVTEAGTTVITDGLMRVIEAIKMLAEAAAIMGDESLNQYYQPFTDLLQGANGRISLAEAFNAFAEGLDLDNSVYEKAAQVADSAHSLGTFARGLAALTVEDSDVADLSLVTTFCDNVKSLVDALTYTTTGDYSSADAFATAIEKIANAGLAEVGKVLKEKQEEATDTIKTYSDYDYSVLGSPSIASTVDTKEIENESIVASDAFTNAAKQMVAALVNEFNSDESKGSVIAALTDLINAATTQIQNSAGEFALAATNLVAGFTNTLGSFHIKLAVMGAAYAIGRAAVTSLKQALDERSPSHESEKIADFFAEGFVIGVDRRVDDVYRGSHGLGEAAVRGLKTSVRAINAMMDSGLDSEPVIRPVLDLTGIQNGTMALNGMLNVGAPIGLYGNLNAINANVNARNMTTNTDILNALNELGTALNERPVQTNNYNVGGVTYDDGTNVAMAVRDLIHAARIERRV